MPEQDEMAHPGSGPAETATTQRPMHRRQAECLGALEGLEVREALAVLAQCTAVLIVDHAGSPEDAGRAEAATVERIEATVALLGRLRFASPVS